jgi:putative hydrolase of the HAD superfamily
VTKRFDAVLFDAGGVLVMPDPTVLAPLLTPYGGSADYAVHHRAHYAGMRAVDRGDEADWNRYGDAYVATVGVPVEEMEEALLLFRSTFNVHLWRYPNEGSAGVLHTLVERRVPIGVVSNASGQIEGVLARAGVCQVGEGTGAGVLCVVDSHVVGVAKPDPGIFVSAVEAIGIHPERIAYVGDSIRYDVGGATAAGLTPLLLDPYGDAGADPHERIESLRELLELV